MVSFTYSIRLAGSVVGAGGAHGFRSRAGEDRNCLLLLYCYYDSLLRNDDDDDNYDDGLCYQHTPSIFYIFVIDFFLLFFIVRLSERIKIYYKFYYDLFYC
jgi:hypothetical protein